MWKCPENWKNMWKEVWKCAQTCPTLDFDIEATTQRNLLKLGSLSSYECPLYKEPNNYPKCQSGQPVGPKNVCTHIRENSTS
jgi:hypothetical protein